LQVFVAHFIANFVEIDQHPAKCAMQRPTNCATKLGDEEMTCSNLPWFDSAEQPRFPVFGSQTGQS
jgi:hypothetical protein